MDLGHTTVVEHVIQLQEGTTPVRARPYPVPESIKGVLRKQIEDLLQAGVIAQSTAPNFVSPIIMIKKKDGSYRMCVDYRKLNECTVKHHQLLPTIPDIANVLAHKRYFSSLDLASGYWQVGMHKDSQELTTFITPDLSTYYWRVLPFGLTNAPASFMRLMNAVLADFIAAGQVICYVDDILVSSATFTEHLELLAQVFQRLQEHNLKLN
jgi:hypothetical protein